MAEFTTCEFQYHVRGRKSCHPTDAESTSTTPFCTSPSMAILRDRNSRLGLKASSPYCRLVFGSPCMLVQGIFTWRKLTRLNEPLFGAPEAETQIIHVCVGSPGCIQLAGESMQCFQDVGTQIPLTTNLTEGIPERIVLLNEREALDFTLEENALIVSHPVNVCRPSSDWHMFSPRMPIAFAMLRRRHLFLDEMSMYKLHAVNFLLECYAKYQDVSVSSNNHN